ncbi:MAG TPA: nucleotidyltransferase domain-containing protein [Lapillicoccus sp.]|nr:nucleotidyltransferase domain-containing protein [Lapillicoccus sp.]
MTLPDLDGLARRLTSVDGVVGVVLGGSRARGEHTPESDVDLGLYYRGDLDTAALGAIARDVAGPDAQVTERGEWGPWVDGGGWLVIDGVHVDWIYREVDRVRDAWARTHRGSYDWNAQAGHPLGVPDFAYVGELALAVVLADPTGELTELRDGLTYPDALRAALEHNLWEADFLLQIAAKAVARADTAYVALCLSRAMLLCAHSLHGFDRRWLVNEKGAIASAGRLPCAPADFERRVCDVLGQVGTSPDQLSGTIAKATGVVEDVKAVWTNET